MFLEQQISILKWFLKVTLKTGVTTDENSALQDHKMVRNYILKYIKIWNSYFKLLSTSFKNVFKSYRHQYTKWLGLTNAKYLRSTTTEAKTKSQKESDSVTYWDCWVGVWWQRVCCSSHTPARCRCPPVAPRGTGAWAQCSSSPAAWLLPLIQPQRTLPAQTKHKHCL